MGNLQKFEFYITSQSHQRPHRRAMSKASKKARSPTPPRMLVHTSCVPPITARPVFPLLPTQTRMVETTQTYRTTTVYCDWCDEFFGEGLYYEQTLPVPDPEMEELLYKKYFETMRPVLEPWIVTFLSGIDYVNMPFKKTKY